MNRLQEQGYVQIWCDDHTDRQAGCPDLSETFFERYGIGIGQWQDDATCEDWGDATAYFGLCPGGKSVVTVEACDGNYLWEKPVELGAKCIVRDCSTHQGERRFIGDLCAPCHQFITDGTGMGSQAHRNAVQFAEDLVGNLIREWKRKVGC